MLEHTFGGGRVMDYKLPKDYKKPDSVEISKMMRDRIGTNMATFEKSLEAVDLI